jgi:hypothetical protein
VAQRVSRHLVRQVVGTGQQQPTRGFVQAHDVGLVGTSSTLPPAGAREAPQRRTVDEAGGPVQAHRRRVLHEDLELERRGTRARASAITRRSRA